MKVMPKTILSQPGNPRCPVNSFKLYIFKFHPNCNTFFQNANTYHKLPTDKWYKNSPANVNTISNFLCSISDATSLSYMYTNHCIRGTTAMVMKCAGYSFRILPIKIWRLRYNLKKLTLEDKENYADDLFKFTGKDDNDSDMSDFEVPPLPSLHQRNKKSNTNQCNCNQRNLQQKQTK